jgi:hypothetical protein
MAKLLGIVGMAIGTIGLFFGFFYLSNEPAIAVNIVVATSVGAVGILAFVRHVIFHKSDAKRLGWETERPDWMFEVGFANLAFGFMGFLAVFANWASPSAIVVMLGYSLYLLQAGILHGYRYFTDTLRVPARLWRSCIATILFSGMTAIFAVLAAVNLHIIFT